MFDGYSNSWRTSQKSERDSWEWCDRLMKWYDETHIDKMICWMSFKNLGYVNFFVDN